MSTTQRVVRKQLAGAEDLLQGVGTVTQTRGTGTYPIHKLDIPIPTYDIAEMQASSAEFMRLYGSDTAYTDYRRNPEGTIGIPSNLGGVLEPMRSSEYLVCGNFATGAYVFSSDCVVALDQQLYNWQGSVPKVVAAGATPATSGGIGAGAWVDRTDVTLRSEINIIQKRFACVADMVSATSLSIGDIVETIGYYGGWSATASKPKGGNRYEIVAAGTGTADGGSFITLANGLQAKSEFSSIIDVYTYGAHGDNSHDDTNAVKAAAAYGRPIKFENGDYYLTENVLFSVSVYADDATIYTDLGITVGGASGAVIKNKTFILPNVCPKNPEIVANTYKSGAGVTLRNMLHSEVIIQHVGEENGGWSVGVDTVGVEAGFAWNKITCKYLQNNRINFRMRHEGTGFNNQNSVWLLHCYKKPHVAGGSPDPDSYHIYIDSTNSNTFYSPAIEIDTFSGRPGAEAVIYITGGSENVIFDAHAEAPVGTEIRLVNTTDNYISFNGSSSGYGNVVVESGTSGYNTIERHRWGSSRGCHRPIVLHNQLGLDRPFIDSIDWTANPNNRTGSENDYNMRFIQGKIKAKASADTYDKIIMDGRSGRHYFGNGLLSPKSFYKTGGVIEVTVNGPLIRDSTNYYKLPAGNSLVTIDAVIISTTGEKAFVKYSGVVNYSGSGDFTVVDGYQNDVSKTLTSVTLNVNTFTGITNYLSVIFGAAGTAGIATCYYDLSVQQVS